jgi:hypothetical protein
MIESTKDKERQIERERERERVGNKEMSENEQQVNVVPYYLKCKLGSRI